MNIPRHIRSVVTIYIIGDIGFCHNHHIVIADLYFPNGLGEAKALDVEDVVHTKV